MSPDRPRSFLPRSALLALAVVALMLGASPGHAQEDPPLQGVVTDDLTGEVIASARITIVGTELETRTGEAGTFAFTQVPLGRLPVRVEAEGYPAITDEVTVSAGEVVFMHVTLPQVDLILGELFVFGNARPRERAPASSARDARTAADILALQIPGVNQGTGVVGKDDALIVLRGVSSINLSSEPAVFLDGIRLGGNLGEAMDALSKIPAEQVRRIRVLRGPAAAFVQGAANGVIFIETRFGPDQDR